MRTVLLAGFFLAFCQIARAQPAPLETGIVPDGVPVYYQIYGNADAPPVLMMHGFGGYFDESAYDWIIEFFSDYKFIGIDVRGHGRSGKPDRPEDYGLELVNDINRLFDHLNLDDAHIIGVSMGGIVGLKYASLNPERVRSLTLVGQGLVPPESYEGWVEMGRAVIDSSERTEEEEASLHMYSGFLRGYPPLLVTEADAAALQIPLLVVIGDEDERLDLARNLRALYPATSLIVAPGFNHFNIMTEPSPFYLAITAFLERNENR